MSVLYPWLTYQQDCTRDLAWLIHSPPLFTTTLGNYAAHVLPKDTAIDEWLAALDQRLNTRNQDLAFLRRSNHRRLGQYAEVILRYFYAEAPLPFRLLAHNVRIYRDSRTLGELDFVLEDPVHRRLQHVELATKFYLKLAGSTGKQWQDWVGPTANDRLDIKLKRMAEHQLPLAHCPEGRARLHSLNRGNWEIESRHLIKGVLFHHIAEKSTGLPHSAHHAALCGHWLYQSELPQVLSRYAACDTKVTMWPKMAWLGGPPDRGEITARDILSQLDAFLLHAAEHRTLCAPLMLAVNKTGQSAVRLMVVDDYWPGTRSPSRRM